MFGLTTNVTHFRKRKTCWLPAFSFFPTMFFRGFFFLQGIKKLSLYGKVMRLQAFADNRKRHLIYVITKVFAYLDLFYKYEINNSLERSKNMRQYEKKNR